MKKETLIKSVGFIGEAGVCTVLGMAINVVMNKYTAGLPLPAKIAYQAMALIGGGAIGFIVGPKVYDEITDSLDIIC